jgi:hypothetical protein
MRFEILSAVTMKNAVFWDLTLCGKNQCFGGIYDLHHQGEKNQRGKKNVSNNQQPKNVVKKYCKNLYFGGMYASIIKGKRIDALSIFSQRDSVASYC